MGVEQIGRMALSASRCTPNLQVLTARWGNNSTVAV